MNRARVLAYVMLDAAYDLATHSPCAAVSIDEQLRNCPACRLADAIDAMWETMLDDEEQQVANEVLSP